MSGLFLFITSSKQKGIKPIDRIEHLDGLRGLAILGVMLFHAYARWWEMVPFGDRFQQVPIFLVGWLGVPLFFMISGFVIFLTLERCSGFGRFIYKRWLRLFPAMFIASLLVYFSAPLFPDRPLGSPTLLSLLPGLTFTEPFWWSKALATPITPLEGAFWSLYVEVKFYLVVGLTYFLCGRRWVVPILLMLFVLGQVCVRLVTHENGYVSGLGAGFDIVGKIARHLSLDYFGWFASGALFYLYFSECRLAALLMGLLVAFASAVLQTKLEFEPMFGAVVMILLFVLSFNVYYLQRLLANRMLLMLGFISYPLYLIHENALIAMIIMLPQYAPWMPELLYPVGPAIFLMSLAYLIARYLEPKFRDALANVIAWNRSIQQ